MTIGGEDGRPGRQAGQAAADTRLKPSTITARNIASSKRREDVGQPAQRRARTG